LRISSKGIRLNTLLARLLEADIIKLGKKLTLVYLLTSKLLCYYKVFKIIVIYKYNNWGNSALEFSIPGFKRVNNSKEFLIIDFVIILYRVEFVAYKSYRV
jgi:hypothetical protein